MTLVMLPEEEWNVLKARQSEILALLQDVKAGMLLQPQVPVVTSNYITAKEFMDAVRIRRSKFDQLVAGSKIKTIKKRHKIYLPVSEIERYFKDSTIP